MIGRETNKMRGKEKKDRKKARRKMKKYTSTSEMYNVI